MNNSRNFITNRQVRNTNKVKAIIAILFMLIFYIQTWAMKPHTPPPGTTLYVTAHSGLHLRNNPSSMSKSLKVINLGESVTVLEQIDSLTLQTIDWVSGKWLWIEHEGDKGYIFDGFLTPLNLPKYSWEKCQLDMDMIYPLEQWSETNHLLINTDTAQGTYITKVTESYENGNKLVKINSGEIYKIELHLYNARIMDAYHLLQAMLEDKTRIKLFQDESIFIKNHEDLTRIKINLENPIDIRKLDNDAIKISIYSQEYPCHL